MKKSLIKYKWEIIFFSLPLLVRLPSLNNFSFSNFPEFFRDYYMAERILQGHITLLGPPSMQAHFNFGPIYYYFLTPLQFIFRGHPVSLIFTGFLLYTLSTVIFYKLLLLWAKDQFTAVSGGLFYALSIYGIHLTSYVSNPNFLPLFVILYLYFLTKSLEKPKISTKDFIILGLIFGIAGQLHVTAVILIGISLWPLWDVFKNLQIKNVIKNLGAFFISAALISAPYVWFELTHKFLNLKSLLNFGNNHLRGGSTHQSFSALFNFFSAALNPFEMNNSFSYLEPNGLYKFVASFALILCILVIYSAIKYKKIRSDPHFFSQTAHKILISWLIFGILLTLVFNRGLHDHYLIILWPLPAILVAFASQWLKNSLKITYSFLIFIVLISGLQIYSFYHKNFLGWEEFYRTYPVRYQNNPDTANIGFSPIQW